MTTPPPPDPYSSPYPPAWFRRACAIAAIALVVCVAYFEPVQECADSVVANESGFEQSYLKTNVVVRACKDADTTSAFVIGAFAFAAILLSPDFSEISLGGFSVKRTLAEQKQQIEKQSEKQEELQRALIAMSVSQTNNNNWTIPWHRRRRQRPRNACASFSTHRAGRTSSTVQASRGNQVLSNARRNRRFAY